MVSEVPRLAKQLFPQKSQHADDWLNTMPMLISVIPSYYILAAYLQLLKLFCIEKKASVSR
jgi:hypothetical protein